MSLGGILLCMTGQDLRTDFAEHLICRSNNVYFLSFAGSEAMFADLGHFNYTAIQVSWDERENDLLWFLCCERISMLKYADCFHFVGLSGFDSCVYGSSCLPI